MMSLKIGYIMDLDASNVIILDNIKSISTEFIFVILCVNQFEHR